MTIGLITVVLAGAVIFFKKLHDLASAPDADKDLYPNIHNQLKKIDASDIPFTQLGGTLNDASAMNRTRVYGVVCVMTENDIKKTLQYANAHNLHVSIAGARHSMGGQAFAQDALVVDMRRYNKMSVNQGKGMLSVQSGAAWHDIQTYLMPYHLSVVAMQSIDVPTVGGTIAVNAHGMDHRIGGIATTIRSMRLMLADTSVLTLSRNENEVLFRSVIGGYGFLGVILDVELELMDDLYYTAEQKVIMTRDFPDAFKSIHANNDIHMFYARLSTAPRSFLKEMVVYTFEVAQSPSRPFSNLASESHVTLRRFVFNLGRKSLVGREIKWWSEKYIQPLLQPKVSSRNQIMHRSYAYLKNNLKNNTDVLQEYFLPQDQLLEFINELGPVLGKHKVINRNVEIRCVHQEDILLDYARGDWFGVVLYLNFNVEQVETIKKVHYELIEITQELGGTFYLPYLLSASRKQLVTSYPHFSKILKLKKDVDPTELFVSEFYNKYK